MIEYLHKKISDIVDINGLDFDPLTGQYQVLYKQDPTEEQLSKVFEILATWKLESARLKKLEEIDKEWGNTVKSGWQTPEGWKLGISPEDITLLTGVFVLTKQASELGLDQEATIIDTDGISHQLNFEQLTELMLQYGNARSELSKAYAEKIRLAKEAITTEELEWIVCQL